MEAGNLCHLPGDILLYLFQSCDLIDNIALSLVCSTFYRLAQKRGFWINALRKARTVRPIACPFHEDLTTHDLAGLKQIALHTLRLQRNWSCDEPRIMGPIKSVLLHPGRLDVIFQVPGTELYLFHSRITGMVSAWDIGLGKQVTPMQYVSHYILDVSPGQDEPGKFSMGLLTSESFTTNNKLVVACLEYSPNGVSLSMPVEHSFANETSHWAVFMTRQIVGVLECAPALSDQPDLEVMLRIVAMNISNGKLVLIKTDVPREEFRPDFSQSGTSTTKGDVFILVETTSTSSVYCCPRSYLPYDDNPDCPPIATLKFKEKCVTTDWSQKLPDYGLYQFEPEGALSSDDFYGVPAVSIHLKERHLETTPHVGLQIRFWTKLSLTGDEDVGSYIAPFHIVDIPGKLQDSPDASWSLVLLPHSGQKVLLMMNIDGRVSLQLINFNPETNESTISNLKLPHFIDIDEIYNLSLDDHRGVITLLHTSGTLHAIPYA